MFLGGLWFVLENWQLRYQVREKQAQLTELRQRDDQLSRQLDQFKVPVIKGALGQEVAGSQPHSLPIVALTLAPGVLEEQC